MFKYFVLSIIIFFLNACGEILSPVIPPINPSENDFIESEYELNLSALNSGINLYSVSIIWNQYDNTDFTDYQLEFDNNIDTINIKLDTTFTINELLPETFKSVYVTTNFNDISIIDSVDIFTRPVFPITNFNIIADATNWHTSLLWQSSEETSFKNYEIYRLDQFNYEDNKFTDLNDCLLLTTITNINTTSYTDSFEIVWGVEYYYMVITNNQENYLRPSIIKSNIDNNINQILLDNIISSNSEYNTIIINWSHVLDAEFYQLEIWRSDSENIDPIDGTQLVVITDKNMNAFKDSYMIGDGLSWFYKIKIIDIYGNYFTSETVVGNSHP